MESFQRMPEPKVILRTLSGYSARGYFMRNRLVTTNDRAATDFRTKEVEKFIEAIDMQFKIHSRIASIEEAEWKHTRGQD